MGLISRLFVDKRLYLKGRYNGFFSSHVSGEYKYQDNLRHIAGPGGTAGVRLTLEATLITADGIAGSAESVRVEIDDLTVGHLPRRTAEMYRRQTTILSCADRRMRCGAVVHGGRKVTENTAFFSVKLDLIWPLDFA